MGRAMFGKRITQIMVILLVGVMMSGMFPSVISAEAIPKIDANTQDSIGNFLDYPKKTMLDKNGNKIEDSLEQMTSEKQKAQTTVGETKKYNSFAGGIEYETIAAEEHSGLIKTRYPNSTENPTNKGADFSSLESRYYSFANNTYNKKSLSRDEILTKTESENNYASVIVSYEDSKYPRTVDYSKLDAKIKYRYTIINAVALEIPKENLVKLSKMPGVDMVYQDHEVKVCLDSSTSVINASQTTAYYGLRGDGVTIAIIDTGIDATHPSLDDMDDDPTTNDSKVIGFYDVINNPDITDGTLTPYDDHGHGTHCAAIAAGTGGGTNYIGVAPAAKLVGVKVLDSWGSGEESGVIAGIEWCIQNKAKYNISIISMSLGANVNSDGTSPLEVECDNAIAAGISVVVAAGNAGPSSNTIGIPACAFNVTTVGAVDDFMSIAYFSSRGPTLDGRIKPDVCAVGVSVTSAKANTNGYVTWQGTSMATPHVAGVYALLLEYNQSLSPSRLKQIIKDSAIDKGDAGSDNTYGWGVVDSMSAVKCVAPVNHSIIVVNIDAPLSAEVNETIFVNSTIRNLGSHSETSIIVDFLVNSTIQNTTTIGFIQNGTSTNVSFSWKPTVVGKIYKIEIYAHPVPGETQISNNLRKTMVIVTCHWTITDEQTFSNQIIPLVGNLTVGNGGNLTFDNVTLQMKSIVNGIFCIRVESGGIFNIYNSYITSVDSDYRYKFEVYGKMYIESCDISYPWGSQNEPRSGGIQVYSSNVTILNSRISYSESHGVYCCNSSMLTISNTTIVANEVAGVMLYYSTNTTISNCDVYNNGYDSISLHYSSNNTIANCDVFNTVYTDGDGIYLFSSLNNNITNCTVHHTYFGSGICLEDSSNNTITNCDVYNNGWWWWTGGIFLYSSSDNNIINCNSYDNHYYGISLHSSSNNNTVTNCAVYNNYYGIYLEYSSNNNLSANYVYNNSWAGIYLYSSSNNKLRNNILDNNKYNFGVFGEEILDYYQDIDTSNKINGKPIYYIIEESNLLYDETYDGGYLGLVSCQNITVKNLEFKNNAQGLLLANTSYSTLGANYVYNNYLYGIGLSSSSNYNQITNCTIYNNNYLGIYLGGSSNNEITNCTIYNNSRGICLEFSSNNNQITNCAVYNGTVWCSYGIEMYDSLNNNITNCNIYNNSWAGISSRYKSFNHEIHYNNIYNNNDYGVYACDSTVNATYNWWGSADGPSGEGPGSGNAVSENVLYDPWLTAPVEINLPPIADFTYYPTAPTIADVINFTDLSYDNNGYIVFWLWDFGDGTDSTLQNSIHQYTTSGAYIVTLTVIDDKGGIGRRVKTIVVVSSGGLTLHDPIYIISNTDFASQALSEGWQGDGTEANPYLIENWDINASSAHGIYIENTNVYFVIRNCYIRNGNFGIYFYNVTHGTINNTTSKNNYYGIYFSHFSSNNLITNCTIYNNSDGIYLGWSSNNNQIVNSSVYNNSDVGIEISSSSNNMITDLKMYNNYYDIVSVSGDVTIHESNLKWLLIYGGANVSISNSTVEIAQVGGIGEGPPYDNASFSFFGTTVNNLLCLNTNATILISNSTINDLYCWWFTGTLFGQNGIVNGNITVGGPVDGGTHGYGNSNFFIKGDFVFSETVNITCWQWSNATRTYDILCYDSDGKPIEGIELKLYLDSTQVWAGTTDALGCAKLDIMFSDSNYTDVWVLEANKGDWNAVENIRFLKSTPVTLTVNRAPIIESYSPLADPTITEEGSQMFTISAYDPDTDDTITIEWYLNNSLVSTATSYTFVANYVSAGGYEVKVIVSDGELSVNHSWILTVTNVNRAPVISSYSPEANPTITEEESQTFTISASDPDGESLIIHWYLNISLVATGGYYTFVANYTSAGWYSVKVVVSDGELSVNRTWILIITNANRSPRIDSYSPLTNPTITEEQSQVFTVSVSDPDDDNIVVNWYLNNTLVGTGTSYTFTANYTSAGWYNVKVVASDGELFVNRTWTLTTTNVNRKPVLNNPLPGRSFDEDSALTAFNLNDYFSDPDGEPLDYTVSGNNHIIVVINPDGTVNLSTSENWYGNETITFRATDPYNEYAEDTIIVTVNPVNDAPIINSFTPVDNPSIDEGEEQVFTIDVSDIDNHALTMQWFLDDNLVTAGNIYIFITNYTSAGIYIVNITVSDGEFYVYHQWTVTVNNVNVIGPSGGSVTYLTAEIIVPPNTVTENVMFNITLMYTTPPAGYEILGNIYNIEANITLFTQPITLIFSYNESDLPANVSEDDLAIYKKVGDNWININSTVDKLNDTVSAQVTSFSDYAILYKQPSTEEEEEGKTPAKPSETTWFYILVPIISIIVLVGAGLGVKRMKKQKPVTVKCPKCGETIEVTSTVRPLELVCPKCGVKGVLEEK